ncbi:MAG: glycosyl hydrolase family 28-related protein [Kiritimatiellia bacterium]
MNASFYFKTNEWMPARPRRRRPIVRMKRFVVWVGAVCAWVSAIAGYPDGTVLDVTQPPYAVVPNDGKNDAKAIQRAVSENLDRGVALYFPNGVYDLDQGIVFRDTKGRWRPHVAIRGESREETVFRLRDQAVGMQDPANPRAVFTTGSFWEPGDSEAGGGNKAFRNNFSDFTLDTGRGNPGAIGIDWAVSNVGVIERVTVRDAGRCALRGISAARRIPGPGLIKDVRIEGFEYALFLDDIQYGISVADSEFTGARTCGITTGKNLLHAFRVKVANSPVALDVSRTEGVATLIDCELKGDLRKTGSVITDAASAEGLALLRQMPTRFPRPSAAAWGAGRSRSNDLAVVGARLPGEPDDTAAIQRAFDSGASTVYFKTGRVYHLSDTLVVRGRLRRIYGMGAEVNLGAAQMPFSNVANPKPLIRIADGAGAVLVEDVFFNAQYPGEVVFEHDSKRDLFIRHCGGWVGAEGQCRSYRPRPNGAGRVFIENAFLPGWVFRGQDVAAIQFNPENWAGDGSEPQVLNDGGRLAIIGFKTEGPAPYLETRNGGLSEVCGGYNYVSATKRLPADRIPYPAPGSRQRITTVADNFGKGDYAAYALPGSNLVRRLRNGDPNFPAHLLLAR